MKPTKFLRFYYILILLLVTACGPDTAPPLQPTATLPPTAIPQLTSLPTATTAPSATTAPTSTTAPTAANEPTATSLPPLITPGSGQIEALDMKAVESDLTQGFAHGFFNGDYVYFIPDTWLKAALLKVVRVDQKNFTQAGTSVLDLQSATSYFIGSLTDGNYGYFPNAEGEVTRLNLKDFSSSGMAWVTLDLGQSANYLSGGFSDGQYAYFGTRLGLYRVDVKNFTPAGTTFLDTRSVDKTTYLWGGVTDGRYGYFASQEVAVIMNGNTNTGGSDTFTKMVRIDLQNFTPSGVIVLDLAGVDPNMMVLYGSFLNAGYLYLAPNQNGKITRIDTKNFTTAGVTSLDLSTIDSGLFGYVSAFTDGTYGYFIPNYYGSSGDAYDGAGKIARVDLKDFTTGGVTWLDLTRLDKSWNNFMDGMADSHYLYLEPGTYAPTGATLNTSVVRISLDYAGWAK
jgi:hypothetical protein